MERVELLNHIRQTHKGLHADLGHVIDGPPVETLRRYVILATRENTPAERRDETIERIRHVAEGIAFLANCTVVRDLDLRERVVTNAETLAKLAERWAAAEVPPQHEFAAEVTND